MVDLAMLCMTLSMGLCQLVLASLNSKTTLFNCVRIYANSNLSTLESLPRGKNAFLPIFVCGKHKLVQALQYTKKEYVVRCTYTHTVHWKLAFNIIANVLL